MQKITDREVRAAYKRYRKGATLRELAEHYGVTERTMSVRLRLLGFTLRSPGLRPGTKWTAARRAAYEAQRRAS